MEIIIKTKGLEMTSELETFINKQISSLKKFLAINAKGLIEVEVGIITKHHQKGNIYSAEILIECPRGKVLRAYSEKQNTQIALTDAKKEIEAQLTKFKDKLLTERKQIEE